MKYKLLTSLSNFVAVADQRKRGASPVPQLQPPGETPSSKGINQGTFH